MVSAGGYNDIHRWERLPGAGAGFKDAGGMSPWKFINIGGVSMAKSGVLLYGNLLGLYGFKPPVSA
jgi:hypothetical protein